MHRRWDKILYRLLTELLITFGNALTQGMYFLTEVENVFSRRSSSEVFSNIAKEVVHAVRNASVVTM